MHAEQPIADLDALTQASTELVEPGGGREQRLEPLVELAVGPTPVVAVVQRRQLGRRSLVHARSPVSDLPGT